MRPALRLEAALAASGVLVAGYLSWSRLTGTKLLCTPGAQCDVVQASPYALFLGIPVAYLGLAAYLVVLALVRARARGWRADLALLAQFALLLVGFVFSAWLTYVELYVIRAICTWCVASAVIVTALLVVTALDVVRASRETG